MSITHFLSGQCLISCSGFCKITLAWVKPSALKTEFAGIFAKREWRAPRMNSFLFSLLIHRCFCTTSSSQFKSGGNLICSFHWRILGLVVCILCLHQTTSPIIRQGKLQNYYLHFQTGLTLWCGSTLIVPVVWASFLLSRAMKGCCGLKLLIFCGVICDDLWNFPGVLEEGNDPALCKRHLLFSLDTFFCGRLRHE